MLHRLLSSQLMVEQPKRPIQRECERPVQKTISLQQMITATRIQNLFYAETALFADKSAIDEELTRLNSHLLSLKDLLQGDGPAGRQLDFLIQELNREFNTIGSKANDFEMSQSVVTMKTILEQIREQVQNLEQKSFTVHLICFLIARGQEG